MKLQNDNVTTPVYLKTDPNMPWPQDRLFYLLTADGMYLCRNHEWFQSCALAKHGPSELESQVPFVKLGFPKVPKAIVQKALGFFRHIEFKKHWESALILVWNRTTHKMELICPDQKASGASVKYDIPKLPQHLALIGDFHSHCDFSPNPSFTDEKDEEARPGLHLVAGYINRPKPEYCCFAVVDGTRFEVKNLDEVMEVSGEGDPDHAPPEWVEKVKPLWGGGGGSYYGYGVDGGAYDWQNQKPDKHDLKVVDKVLNEFGSMGHRPTEYDVSEELFVKTRQAGRMWCQSRAREFLKDWDKAHETQTTT